MKIADRILAGFALFGLSINLLLLYWKISDSSAGIAGCGGGDCDVLLESRWAVVFGLPVTAAGALLYLLFFSALIRRWRTVRAGCEVAFVGAACWFMFVQGVLVGKFCPWCVSAHLLGAVVGIGGLVSSQRDPAKVRGMRAGLFAAMTLALAQLYGPVPEAYRIDAFPATGGRELSFEGGHRRYDAMALPRIGRADATHVMVEYFDYRCPACRTMAGYLDALVSKHPERVAVLVLPVPLERSCNGSMATADSDHPGSCELARIALAVWRVKPAAFPEIHQTFLTAGSVDEGQAMAAARMPEADLEAALADPWIAETLQTHILDWAMLSTSTRKLPKLIIRDGRLLHGLPSGEEEFIRVMESELGL